MTSIRSSDPLPGDVDHVLITAELASRPSRAPDYETESGALGLLAQEMAANPRGVLQKCAELVMQVCGADSAGISILEPGGTSGILRWHAAAGGFAANLHGTMPREASPCGTVMERDCVLLFQEAERFFPALGGVEPRIYENLLTPWHLKGKAVGTLWAIKHTPEGRFDAEDARVLQSLARFAAAAFQMTLALDEAAAERTELEQRTKALRESEQRWRLIVGNARDYAIFTTDPEGIVTDWHEGAEAVFGFRADEIIGHDDGILFTPEDRAHGQPEKERATARSEGKADNVRWHVRKGGERVFIEGVSTALRQFDGSLTGFLKIGRDATDRHTAEQRQKMLLAELQHRVRNILAMIRSVVTRTASEDMSAYDYAQHLAGRLDAMARTQSIITRSPSEGIEIEDLVREELLAQAPAEDRFHLEGPAVLLSPKAAEVLTLAVHELATNSIKYGSLGAEGELSVTWGVEERDAEDWLALVWEEAGVENSGPAARHGFGTELITKRVPYELEGTGMIEIESRGMRATIAFPLRDIGSILETGSATRQEQRA